MTNIHTHVDLGGLCATNASSKNIPFDAPNWTITIKPDYSFQATTPQFTFSGPSGSGTGTFTFTGQLTASGASGTLTMSVTLTSDQGTITCTNTPPVTWTAT